MTLSRRLEGAEAAVKCCLEEMSCLVLSHSVPSASYVCNLVILQYAPILAGAMALPIDSTLAVNLF